MAVNKELLERYKAMKAAKLAQNEQSGQIPKTGFSALSQSSYTSAPTSIRCITVVYDTCAYA